MSVIKREKRSTPFVQIDKRPLQNKELSWKAKGILAYILSLPDNWQLYLNELKEHATDGRDSTASGFKELVESGYIVKSRIRKAGQFKGFDYIVSETPQTALPKTENPKTVKPKTVNPKTENPQLIIIDNKDKDLKDKDYKDTVVCRKEKDTQIQNLKIELSLLKKEKEEERKKVAAKKERSPVDKRDKRTNKQLPFDIVSARKTVDAIFPTWKELDKQYKEVFNDPASEEIYKKCLKSFVETGIGSYYSSIRTIDKLIVKLLEWTKQEVKYQSNNAFKSTKQPQINQFIMKEEDCMLHKNTWLND
jgi:hypothetical protein